MNNKKTSVISQLMNELGNLNLTNIDFESPSRKGGMW